MTEQGQRRYQDATPFRDMNRLSDYRIIQKLGQGTFGVVQKATNKKTGRLVALKQLLNHLAKEGFPITAMREIIILKQLNHHNILKIVDMIYEPPQVSNPQDLVTNRGCFYTVSDYMSSDLVGLLENPNISLQLSQIKCLLQQLLHGIQFIHENNFLHRDIKAANILIDFNGVLQVADFGLARIYHGNIPTLGNGPGGGERAYTGLVVTRWYRPPELLLGERKYTTAVDMWGIGCVFAELFTQKPILVGKTDAHQAQLVFSLVGSPKDWSYASTLPNNQDFVIGMTCKRSLESRFKLLIPDDGINLLSGLLALDPYKRLNALDALEHDFFKSDPIPLKPHQLPKFEESHEIDKERFKKLKESKDHGIAGYKANNSHTNSYNKNSYNHHEHHNSYNSYSSHSNNSQDNNRGHNGDRKRYNDNKSYNSNNSYNDNKSYNGNNSYDNKSYNSNNSYNSKTPTEPRGIQRRDNYIPSNRSSLNLSDSYRGVDSYTPKKLQDTRGHSNTTDSYVPRQRSSGSLNDMHYRAQKSDKPTGASLNDTHYRAQISEPTEKITEYASLRNRSPSSKSAVTSKPTNNASESTSKPIFTSNPIKPLPINKPSVNNSGLFMPQKRKAPVTKVLDSKRTKTHDEHESDLSDSGDITKKDEKKLDEFLDNENFQKDSEFRKVANERIRFIKKKQSYNQLR